MYSIILSGTLMYSVMLSHSGTLMYSIILSHSGTLVYSVMLSHSANVQYNGEWHGTVQWGAILAR